MIKECLLLDRDAVNLKNSYSDSEFGGNYRTAEENEASEIKNS